MTIESKEQYREMEKLGNIQIEKTIDGKIVRINRVEIGPNDKILIVQRHQKPEPFSKDDLLASAKGKQDPQNLDYTYEPAATEKGTEIEKDILDKFKKTFGDFSLIETTPRKRGAEHRNLLAKEFPSAKTNKSIRDLLDDSGIGLIGESEYGAFKFTPEETQKLFNPKLTKEARFGKGPYEGQRKPYTYMESWIQFGYMKPGSRWKADNPEEFAEKTKSLLDRIERKNFFITHEANVVTLRMLAERKPEEIKNILDKISLPEQTRSLIKEKISDMTNLLNLLKTLRQELQEHPVAGFHYKKVLSEFLENIKLRSGNNGYGAISIFVAREKPGQKQLVEAAYDEQI